ncbi:hypothetical protein [Microbulbifer sp. JSM ZJ756]
MHRWLRPQAARCRVLSGRHDQEGVRAVAAAG